MSPERGGGGGEAQGRCSSSGCKRLGEEGDPLVDFGTQLGRQPVEVLWEDLRVATQEVLAQPGGQEKLLPCTYHILRLQDIDNKIKK